MNKLSPFIALILLAIIFARCDSGSTTSNESSTNEQAAVAGQASVQDDESMKDVVKIAVGSKDHTTLVAALKQAELVDVLANPGPFTVFAPTNAAFDALPAGTLEGLMKDEKKTELQDILQYHVTTSSLKAESFSDGQVLGMVNGGSVKINVKDGKVTLNGSATIVASVQGSNGIVHVIDKVLLPVGK
jgi:uncharacterized surface protein with fasciclin (FAS1) repeats